jgi:Na+/melibiose symporter-like transporter
MSLDLRIPMGLMFTLVGVILAAFGFVTRNNEALYARSLGININFWWGVAVLAFGLTMFLLGRINQKQLARAASIEASPTRREH